MNRSTPYEFVTLANDSVLKQQISKHVAEKLTLNEVFDVFTILTTGSIVDCCNRLKQFTTTLRNALLLYIRGAS
jgi:hypothetical protein